MNSLLKYTLASFFLLSSATLAFAQIPVSLDGIDIKSFPVSPAPKQNVTVSIESYNTDLNGASIVWLVDGKNFSQGTGLKSIEITAPSIGSTKVVVAAIRTSEGREIQKRIVITSGEVDIIWESAGYIPPLYKGKAHFAYQNEIRISAVPHLSLGKSGVELNPNTLIYKWTVNDKVLQDQSGYGKQSIIYKTDTPREINIKVDVSNREGSVKGMSSITLTPAEPSITFYEDNSLYGVLYNKALVNRVNLTNQEINIIAAPYSFSTNSGNPLLKYAWSINGFAQNDLLGKQSITLRAKGDAAGSTLVSLNLRNEDDILQGAESSVTVYFSKKEVQSNPAF